MKTAKDRTATIPGVNVGATPQTKIAARVVKRVTIGVPGTTHYAAVPTVTICGEKIASRDTRHNPDVCQACRVEASRMRAVVR